MPLHAVVGHLVVIVAPLAALLAVLYATVPRARRPTRWPLVAAAAVAFGLVVWAGEVGGDLLEHLEGTLAASGEALPAAVDEHAHGSSGLAAALFVLLVVVVSVVPRALAPGRTPGRRSGRVGAAALLVIGAWVLYATATTLAQAMAAVWSHHPGWP